MKSNPQISRRLIISLLIGEVVGIVVYKPSSPISDDELADEAMKRIKNLLEYSSTRDIDIPIVNLNVDGTPVGIGSVTFHPVTHTDLNKDWWEKIKTNYSGTPEKEVLSIARVTSPGDWELALDFAEEKVQETLLILRGIGFPIKAEDLCQIGVLNEFPNLRNQAIQLHEPVETIKIEDPPKVITRLGSSIRKWRLHTDLLEGVDKEIKIINNLLDKNNKSSLNKMQKKVLSGLRWIGEATKPDPLSARYIKLSTALEFLIGGEPENEYLSTRGITATLAERAAFLIGKDLDDRLNIDKKVKHYYRLRSDIVHGVKDTIDGPDFEGFGSLVRQISLALCQKLSDFNNIDDLQKWVYQNRYAYSVESVP